MIANPDIMDVCTSGGSSQ